MIKIILGFAVIFTLIYFAYKYIVGLDDVELESLMKKAPTIALCALAAMFIATFIVVSF